MIHVFSTKDEDKKPMTMMMRTQSTPLPASLSLGSQLYHQKSLAPSASRLLSKEFNEHDFGGAAMDPSGLFDFKQPEL